MTTNLELIAYFAQCAELQEKKKITYWASGKMLDIRTTKIFSDYLAILVFTLGRKRLFLISASSR